MVWELFKTSKASVPVTGEHADFIWSTFLKGGLTSGEYADEVFRYLDQAKSSQAAQWDKTYETIILHFLLNSPGKVVGWHDRLQIAGDEPRPEILPELVFAGSRNAATLRALNYIRQRQKLRGIYALLIPVLCQERRYDEALEWHAILTADVDLPLNITSAQPLLHFLSLTGASEKARAITKELFDAGVSFPEAPRSPIVEPPKLSTETINRMFGNAFRISEKPFDDELGARLFTTAAFPVEAILQGLTTFGINNIGPQSLRELLRREDGPKQMVERITSLYQLGFDIGDHAFCHLVSKLATQNRSRMLEEIVRADRDLSYFEDPVAQDELANYHMGQENWKLFQQDMVIRSELSVYSEVERWNLILRAYIKDEDLFSAMETLDKMRLFDIPVSSQTSDAILQLVFTFTSHERLPEPGEPSAIEALPKNPLISKDLRLIANILVTFAKAGGKVLTTQWKLLLEGFLKLHQFSEVEKLTMWLADWYSGRIARRQLNPITPSTSLQVTGMATVFDPSAKNSLQVLEDIFTKDFVTMLIQVPFQHQFSKIGTREYNYQNAGNIRIFSYRCMFETEDWSRGLGLVKRLQERGVRIRDGSVRLAMLSCLHSLYSKSENSNNLFTLMRHRNPFSALEFMDAVEEVWNGTFFENQEFAATRNDWLDVISGPYKLAPLLNRNLFLASSDPTIQRHMESVKRIALPKALSESWSGLLLEDAPDDTITKIREVGTWSETKDDMLKDAQVEEMLQDFELEAEQKQKQYSG
jgi:hypothetical protein